MLVPEPPVKLEGHCSVIHENTLYTYSENGFAAIPLKRDGGWTQPPTEGAELVSKAACVIGGVDGNEHQKALYVVGGTSSKSKNSKTPALQRYTFKDRKWKSISFDQANLVNRTSHSAVYLESISTIMVYGGSMTDSEQKSADSFSVTTGPEYILNSVTGKSPAILPALFAWDDETAVLFGGDTTETRTQFWSKGDGHWNLGEQNLTSELPEAKTALLTRSNGEKILQTFDTSASPVTVKQLFKSKQSDSSKKQERAANDMPKYDDSLAPTTTAEGASLAQSYGSDDQLVVLSGGGGTDSLSIFNQTSNSWVNSTKLFYGDKTEQEILGSITPTSSSQPSPTTSESSTPSEPVGGGGGGSSNDNVGVILGAVLGSLAGVAIILVLILFYIRRKEKMRQAGGLDKDRLSFQDQGVEPLARSAYPMAESPAPRAAGSMDSLAIFSGNMGDEKGPKPAGSLPQHMQKSQPARPSPLNNIHSSDGDDKAIEAGASAVRPGDRTTDEGWGKYFQDNHTTPTLVGMQSPFDSTRDSKATIWPGNNNTNSLPPLDTNFLHQPTPLGRVNSGSPTAGVATSVVDGRQIVIAEGQSARISSADSASIVSEEDPERYNPIREHSWLGRPPSSAYSRSFYNPHSSTRELPSTAVPSTATPSTVDYRKHDSARTNTRGSSVLIPDGQPLPRNNVNSDMSWLNIHADR